MANVVNHAPAVVGLQLQRADTLHRIDQALDRGDRRAFRVWCRRFASLSTRIELLLYTIVTAEE